MQSSRSTSSSNLDTLFRPPVTSRLKIAAYRTSYLSSGMAFLLDCVSLNSQSSTSLSLESFHRHLKTDCFTLYYPPALKPSLMDSTWKTPGLRFQDTDSGFDGTQARKLGSFNPLFIPGWRPPNFLIHSPVDSTRDSTSVTRDLTRDSALLTRDLTRDSTSLTRDLTRDSAFRNEDDS